MNIEQQTPMFECKTAGVFLDPEMSSLLQMTDAVLMKIKQQVKDVSV